jgi:NSS family neurotransmitter:Na+ symporter
MAIHGNPVNLDGSAAWTSRFAFLLASVGFAVGLGNIWRFPYVTGENGGAAFVAVYLFCVFVIGVPILMAELFIGRRGGLSPSASMQSVARASGRSVRWGWVGSANLLAAFSIMVTYSVVAGWVLSYLFKALLTGFVGIDALASQSEFESLKAGPWQMLGWTLLALALTGSIIFAGVQQGIERAVKILMPSLFALMLMLVGYNMVVGGFGETVEYLFTPDFSKIDGSTWLAAVGQAFFSIGVAMAGMMTFGAYLPASVSIPRAAITIALADTLVALLAGLVIFPAVFANGLDPASGPGLIFQTLPVALAQMPGGHLVGVMFFLLLSVAAITSMVGLIEPLVHRAQERGLSRHWSTLTVVSAIAGCSVASVLGYNVWSGALFGSVDINTLLDFFANQVLLPLGGLFIAVFAGWFVLPELARQELNLTAQSGWKTWQTLIRWPVPIAITLIFIAGVS